MGEPKATLQVHGEALLARQVRLLRSAGIVQIAVVLAPDHPEACRLAESLSLQIVINPRPERGMASSIQMGAQAIAGSVPRPVLLLPVDCAFARRDDLECILSARLAADDAEEWIWRPSAGGKSGHPVLFGSKRACELAALEPHKNARDYLREHAAQVRWVEVANPFIGRDLDVPLDLHDLPPLEL